MSFKKPKVPKVEKATPPVEADAKKDQAETDRLRPRGRDSLVKAGALKKKATTIKSTLLGE